jgi:hypothetical protein
MFASALVFLPAARLIGFETLKLVVASALVVLLASGRILPKQARQLPVHSRQWFFSLVAD